MQLFEHKFINFLIPPTGIIKYCSDISHHFVWYRDEPLSSFYYEGFIEDNTSLNEHSLINLQESVLAKFRADTSIKLSIGCLFIAIEVSPNNKIENYLKVWKKISKKYDISSFYNLKEAEFFIGNRKFFIGTASFDYENLNKALSICIAYEFQKHSLILLNNNAININDNIENEPFCKCVLNNDAKEFSFLIREYAIKGYVVVRYGCGGEDFEFDFIFRR